MEEKYKCSCCGNYTTKENESSLLKGVYICDECCNSIIKFAESIKQSK